MCLCVLCVCGSVRVCLCVCLCVCWCVCVCLFFFLLYLSQIQIRLPKTHAQTRRRAGSTGVSIRQNGPEHWHRSGACSALHKAHTRGNMEASTVVATVPVPPGSRMGIGITSNDGKNMINSIRGGGAALASVRHLLPLPLLSFCSILLVLNPPTQPQHWHGALRW